MSFELLQAFQSTFLLEPTNRGTQTPSQDFFTTPTEAPTPFLTDFSSLFPTLTQTKFHPVDSKNWCQEEEDD